MLGLKPTNCQFFFLSFIGTVSIRLTEFWSKENQQLFFLHSNDTGNIQYFNNLRASEHLDVLVGYINPTLVMNTNKQLIMLVFFFFYKIVFWIINIKNLD